MKKALIFFSAIFFFIFLAVSSASAIEYGMLGGKPANPDPNVENSNAWFVYSIPAGETRQDAIEVMNLFDSELEVLVYAADTVKSSGGGFALRQFSEKNESVGSWVKFYPDEIPGDFKNLFEKKESKIFEFCKISREELQKEFGKKELSEEQFVSLESWCKGKDSIERSFSSKERVKIPFTISIPSGVDVGEHTGGILIQKKSQDETSSAGGSSVKLTTRVGVRIYETVPGEIVKKINIDYFRVVRNFSEFSFSDWFGEEKKPKEFLLETQVSNLGNVSISHQNNLYIKDVLFGKRDEEVKREFQALKGDKFIANYSWKKPLFGYYSFQPEIKYENAGKEEVLRGDAVKMWVIPWREISIFSLLAGIIILGIYLWKRRQQKLYGGSGWVNYAVQKGDTLVGLAQNHGIDWEIFAKTNKIRAPYLISEGQSILVPPSGEDILLEKEIEMKKQAAEENVPLAPKKSTRKNEKVAKMEAIVEIKEVAKPEVVAEKCLLMKKCNCDREKCLKVLAVIVILAGMVFIVLALVTFYKKKNKDIVIEEKISIATMKEEVDVRQEKQSYQQVEQKEEQVQPLRSKNELSVRVLNGGAVPGSAGKVKDALISRGYVKTEATNASKDSYEGILLYNGKGLEKNAEELAKELKILGFEVVLKGELPEDSEEEIGDLGILLGA